MKQTLPNWAVGVIGAAVVVLVLGVGYVFFQKATGAPAEDIDLAKKQAAVEHRQFQGKIGGPPDAGAGELAARAQGAH